MSNFPIQSYFYFFKKVFSLVHIYVMIIIPFLGSILKLDSFILSSIVSISSRGVWKKICREGMLFIWVEFKISLLCCLLSSTYSHKVHTVVLGHFFTFKASGGGQHFPTILFNPCYRDVFGISIKLSMIVLNVGINICKETEIAPV